MQNKVRYSDTATEESTRVYISAFTYKSTRITFHAALNGPEHLYFKLRDERRLMAFEYGWLCGIFGHGTLHDEVLYNLHYLPQPTGQ